MKEFNYLLYLDLTLQSQSPEITHDSLVGPFPHLYLAYTHVHKIGCTCTDSVVFTKIES